MVFASVPRRCDNYADYFMKLYENHCTPYLNSLLVLNKPTVKAKSGLSSCVKCLATS